MGDDLPAPPPPSDNVIDVAIWPRMISDGATDLVKASTAELCRRMSLDLTGSVPSPGQVSELCEGKTPDEMARSFFTLPGYVAREQKLWMQHLRVNPDALFADHIVDADAIIADYANGAFGYDDYAAKILAHPVAAINRNIGNAGAQELDDAVFNAYRLFMGRAPLADEVADIRNLFRVWNREHNSAGEIFGITDYGYYVYFATLTPSVCTSGIYGDAACTSDWFGSEVTVSLPITDSTYYYSIQDDVPADLQQALEVPARLLATQDEFWNEAVDHALTRFTGWWKSSSNVADTELPEVRSALAQWFRETHGHDIRDLYRMIVTSLLYTTTADVDDSVGLDASPWQMGPTKAMDATQFVDSLEVVMGRELGFCDIHTSLPTAMDAFFPDRLRKPQPEDFYGFGYDFYYSYASALGGCRAGTPEPNLPGFPALLAHTQLADALCSPPSAITPEAFDITDPSPANVAALISFQTERFLSREPEGDEQTALSAAADECLAEAECGMEMLPQELCASLLRSGAFLFY